MARPHEIESRSYYFHVIDEEIKIILTKSCLSNLLILKLASTSAPLITNILQFFLTILKFIHYNTQNINLKFYMEFCFLLRYRSNRPSLSKQKLQSKQKNYTFKKNLKSVDTNLRKIKFQKDWSFWSERDINIWGWLRFRVGRGENLPEKDSLALYSEKLVRLLVKLWFFKTQIQKRTCEEMENINSPISEKTEEIDLLFETLQQRKF